MKIGICDDEKSTREYLEKLSKEWEPERGVSVETVCFADAERFLFAWEECRDFDVLLLDIEMGRMNGMVTITLEDIWYVEAFAHDCAVYLKNRDYRVRRSIGELERLFSEKGLSFVRTHRSYLVNLKYVSSVWKEDVMLDDGRRVPLSRRMRQQVNEEFVRCFAKEGQRR